MTIYVAPLIETATMSIQAVNMSLNIDIKLN